MVSKSEAFQQKIVFADAPEVLDRLRCPLCWTVQRDSVCLPCCKYIACRACITSLKVSECPACVASFGGEVPPSVEHEAAVKQLAIKCPLGCSWEGKLADIEGDCAHSNICPGGTGVGAWSHNRNVC